jgi:opacity protein-like surface antigen
MCIAKFRNPKAALTKKLTTMKKAILKSLLAVAFLVLSTHWVKAQNGRYQTSIGFGVQTAVPFGEFADDYNETPVGIAVNLTSPIKNSPIHWGFDFAWNALGADRQDIFIADGDYFSSANLKVATNRYSYNATMRLSPFKGRIQPYFEGIAGISTYISKSEISGTYANGVEFERKDRFSNNNAWNYGWAAGLQYRIAPHIFLEGRVARIHSTETTFLHQKDMEIDSYGNLDYELMEIRPQFMTIQAGLTFKF